MRPPRAKEEPFPTLEWLRQMAWIGADIGVLAVGKACHQPEVLGGALKAWTL